MRFEDRKKLLTFALNTVFFVSLSLSLSATFGTFLPAALLLVLCIKRPPFLQKNLDRYLQHFNLWGVLPKRALGRHLFENALNIMYNAAAIFLLGCIISVGFFAVTQPFSLAPALVVLAVNSLTIVGAAYLSLFLYGGTIRGFEGLVGVLHPEVETGEPLFSHVDIPAFPEAGAQSTLHHYKNHQNNTHDNPPSSPSASYVLVPNDGASNTPASDMPRNTNTPY